MGDRDYPVSDLGEAIELVAGAAVAGVNVALPGRVEKYDAATQRANVLPLVMARTREGAPVATPVLVNVPVLWPTFGGFVLIGPLEVGDVVQLVFNDRSTDDWKASQGGAAVAPASVRRHSLADAVAIPGVRPFGAPRTFPPTKGDGLYLGQSGYMTGSEAEQVRFEITKDGKIVLGSGVNNALGKVRDAIEAIRTSAFGPYTMDPATQGALAALVASLDELLP